MDRRRIEPDDVTAYDRVAGFSIELREGDRIITAYFPELWWVGVLVEQMRGVLAKKRAALEAAEALGSRTPRRGRNVGNT